MEDKCLCGLYCIFYNRYFWSVYVTLELDRGSHGICGLKLDNVKMNMPEPPSCSYYAEIYMYNHFCRIRVFFFFFVANF